MSIYITVWNGDDDYYATDYSKPEDKEELIGKDAKELFTVEGADFEDAKRKAQEKCRKYGMDKGIYPVGINF